MIYGHALNIPTNCHPIRTLMAWFSLLLSLKTVEEGEEYDWWLYGQVPVGGPFEWID